MDPKVQGRKLLDAIFGRKYDVAMEILRHPVDFTAERGGDNAIHLAARAGRLDLIKAMLDNGADAKQKNQNGNTAAHYAAKEGNLEILQYLRTQRVDMNCTSNDGNAPLHRAVIHQPLNVIEKLVDLGMSPNIQNPISGETPVHTAVAYGRLSAVEGLLIKGGIPDIPDKQNNKPEDIASSPEMKKAMASYTSLYSALQSGFVQAAGLKLSQESVSNRLRLNNVGIYIDSIDIPKGLPISFYCRRERSENSSVPLKTRSEEHMMSDVFHIEISDSMRDCHAKIYMPIYLKPPEKEELVVRFVTYEQEDKVVDEIDTIEGALYCLIETTLVPETACVCIAYTRPKQENNDVCLDGTVLRSKLEPEFKMEIPAETFSKDTRLSMKIYDSHINDTDKGTNIQLTKDDETSLITDVFQFNVSGAQPGKSLTMQLPTCGSMDAEEMVILTMDERKLDTGALPEVVQVTPTIINTNIVFEVSHFCIYVAVPKESVATEDNLKMVTKEISNVKNRRKKATFLAVCKQVQGRKHTLLVDCGLENRKDERMKKWLNKGYEKCENCESDVAMFAPGDTFFVDIKGCASFEKRAHAQQRKLAFSQCRSSFQAFTIQLDEDIVRPEDAVASVIINKKDGTTLEEVFKLNVPLHVPPKYGAERQQEIQFDFIAPTNCVIGEDMTVGCYISNVTPMDKAVNIRMTLSSVKGNELSKVKEETSTAMLEPKMNDRRVMIVPAKEYLVQGHNDFEYNLTTHCTVTSTNEMHISVEKFTLSKPNVEIECDESLTVGSKNTATLSFTNNTSLILHGGVFNVNANFIVEAKKLHVKKEIDAGEVVTMQVPMAPKKVGVWQLVATFQADELAEITGVRTINVSGK